MPKMKTHRGAAKRFKVTSNGKLKRKQAYNSHLFVRKSSKKKRKLNRRADVAPADAPVVRKVLGTGKPRE